MADPTDQAHETSATGFNPARAVVPPPHLRAKYLDFPAYAADVLAHCHNIRSAFSNL
jgi:hypothetical protein